MPPRFLTACAALVTALLAQASAHSQPVAEPASADSWPNKPIRLVVPYPPGGSTDTVSRLVFDAVSKKLGQPVIVENRPGANGSIGVAAGGKAAPDGYTFISVLPAYAVNTQLYAKLPYRLQDFTPVSHLVDIPMFLFVAKQIPAKSVKELVAYGKTHSLNYASSGVGSNAHFLGARLTYESKIDAQHVPYPGSAPILADLIQGQVSMVFEPILGPMPHAKAGKFKVLALASAQRLPSEPDIPTMEEAGFPGFVMSPWVGVIAPAGTPQPIVARMSAALREVMTQPEIRQRTESLGYLAVGSDAPGFQRLIDKELTTSKSIIDYAQIKVE